MLNNIFLCKFIYLYMEKVRQKQDIGLLFSVLQGVCFWD